MCAFVYIYICTNVHTLSLAKGVPLLSAVGESFTNYQAVRFCAVFCVRALG